MKIKLNMSLKDISDLSRYLIIATLSLFSMLQSEAQVIRRQSIGGYGSGMVDGVLVQQTTGQPYATTAFYSNEISVRPGFQQPSKYVLETIHSNLTISLNVYPNPATSSVTIQSPEAITNALIQVRDMDGNLVLNEKVAELKTYWINSETWQKGFYFINLYDGQNNMYSSKLIISK